MKEDIETFKYLSEWYEDNKPIAFKKSTPYTLIQEPDRKRYIGTSSKTLGDKLRKYQYLRRFPLDVVMQGWGKYEQQALSIYNQFKNAIIDNETSWKKYKQDW